MDFVESLNAFGVDVIIYLQSKLPTWGQFFMDVSFIGDPSLAFTFYFPLTAALDLQLGVSLLWTLIMCEWSNMILKWVMAGDRPFWWIHETPYYLNKNLPYMRQYPMSCETGPGMPSGHSTLNAALFFVLARALTTAMKRHLKYFFSEKTSSWIIRSVWITYGCWIGLVMISRTFIAAHFPHQCLTGALIGIITAFWITSKNVLQAISKKRTVILTTAILVSVGTVFGAYRALGNNPMWSVGKAVRWCIKREYIHIDSTPFYSLSRFAGQSFGLGLALASSHYGKINFPRFSWKMKFSLGIVTMATGQSAVFIHRLLPSSVMGYYLLEFLLNASLPYLVVTALPYFVMISSGVKPKTKLKK